MLSIPDMAILGVLALLVFGEEKLPGIMRQAGRVMREVQNTSQSFVREMERAADLHEPARPVTPQTHEPAPELDEEIEDSDGVPAEANERPSAVRLPEEPPASAP